MMQGQVRVRGPWSVRKLEYIKHSAQSYSGDDEMNKKV
jgi:hypothetical protein